MFNAALVLGTSFLISFLIIPAIIHLALKRNLYANIKPVLKGQKVRKITNLGGVAIFVGLRITHSLLIEIPDFPANFISATLFILFLFGLNDDLTGVRPISRLLAQAIVAFIMIVPAQLYFESLGRILGIEQNIPFVFEIITAIFIVGLVNAFNLIDGIDGLAGVLGLLGSIVFAYLFFLNGDEGFALFSLALFGALAAFLAYNLFDAKIFMGDSGAYTIGFVFAILSVRLVNRVDESAIQFAGIQIRSAYGIITAISIIPLFDTLRVLVLRICRGSHPFRGDNNHIHHRLLKMGLSHSQISLSLGLATCMFIFIAFSLQAYSPFIQILILFGLALVLNTFLHFSFAWKTKSKPLVE